MGKTILILIKKAPLLSRAQLSRLASICADISQISLGSVVIPALFDKPQPQLVLSGGIITTVLFWYLSIWIEGKKL